MPKGNYPDVLARATTIGGVKHRKGDPHPAKGLSKNKFLSDGTPRKARKTRSKLEKKKEELGFIKDYKSLPHRSVGEEYIYRKNMLEALNQGAITYATSSTFSSIRNLLEEIEDHPDKIFSKEVSDLLQHLKEDHPDEYDTIRAEEEENFGADALELTKQVGSGHPNVARQAYYDIDRTATPQKGGRVKHHSRRSGGVRRVGEEIDYADHPHFVSEAILDDNLRNTKDDDYEDYSKDYYRGNVVEDVELPLGPSSKKEQYARLGLFSELLTTKGLVRQRAKRSDFGKKIGRYKDVVEETYSGGPTIVKERGVGRSYKGQAEDKASFDGLKQGGSIMIQDGMVMPETATDMDGNPIELGGPYQQFVKDDASSFLEDINFNYAPPKEQPVGHNVQFKDSDARKKAFNYDFGGDTGIGSKGKNPFHSRYQQKDRTLLEDNQHYSHMGIDPHAIPKGELTLDMIQNPDKYVLEGKDLKYDTFGTKGLSQKRAEKYGVKLIPKFGAYHEPADTSAVSDFMGMLEGGGAIAEKIAKTINVKPPSQIIGTTSFLGGGASVSSSSISSVPPLIEGSDLDKAVQAKKSKFVVKKSLFKNEEGRDITFKKKEDGKFFHPSYIVSKGEDGKLFAKKRKKPKFVVKKKDSP